MYLSGVDMGRDLAAPTMESVDMPTSFLAGSFAVASVDEEEEAEVDEADMVAVGAATQ
jgi:hypothetical protein